MQALYNLLDPVFALIGGPKQLPLYLLLLPIPIVLWLFWTEIQAAIGRESDDSGLEQFLHVVDGFSAAVGKTYGWCILVLTFTTLFVKTA